MKSRYLIVPALLFLVAFLPVVSADSAWTTTAEFDAGTYSADDYRQTTSSTCDTSMPADQIGLASLGGDEFCVADTDANTWAWNTCTAGGSSTGAIASGTLTLTIPATTGQSIAFRSDSTISGDVDTYIKIDDSGTNPTNSAQWNSLLNENVCRYSDTGTVDGVLYDAFRNNGATSFDLYAFTVTDGGVTACGSATTLTADPIWLRMTRVTNTWTFYYSDDGSSWTQDESCSHTVTGGLYVNNYFDDNADAGAGSTVYDNWYAVATVPWRTTGTWLSQMFDAATGVATITLVHSGLSADLYIDEVALWQSGNPIQTWATNIITGTTTILTVTAPETGTDFQVIITLAGDGTGTPVVESVNTVDKTVCDPTSPGPNWVMIGLYTVLMIAFVVIGVVVNNLTIILAGIAGMLLGFEVWQATCSVPGTTLYFLIPIFLLLWALSRKTYEGRDQ